MTQEEKTKAVEIIHVERKREVETILRRVGYCRGYVKRILKKKDQDLFWTHYQDLLMKKDDGDYDYTEIDVRIAREFELLITYLMNADGSLNTLFKMEIKL